MVLSFSNSIMSMTVCMYMYVFGSQNDITVSLTRYTCTVCHYPEPRDAFCIHPIFDSRYGLYRSFSGDVSAIPWGKLQEYGYKNGFHSDLAGFAVFLEQVALMLTPFEDEFMHM